MSMDTITILATVERNLTYLNRGYKDEQVHRGREGVGEKEKKVFLVFQPDGVVRPGTVVVHVDDTSIGYSIYSSKLSVVTVELFQ